MISFPRSVNVLFLLFGLFQLMNALYTQLVIERQVRLALIDFLRGLVELDPLKRWSPVQVIIEFVLFSTLTHLSNYICLQFMQNLSSH